MDQSTLDTGQFSQFQQTSSSFKKRNPTFLQGLLYFNLRLVGDGGLEPLLVSYVFPVSHCLRLTQTIGVCRLPTPKVRRAERVLAVSYFQVFVGKVPIADQTKTVCTDRDRCEVASTVRIKCRCRC